MRQFLPCLVVALVTLAPTTGFGADQSTPEEVVERAMDALNHGKLDVFIRAIHSDALAETRTMVNEVFDVAVQQGKEDLFVKSFPGVKDAAALRALDAPGLLTVMLAKVTADPELKKTLAATKVDALGRTVNPAKDQAYVVYRTRSKFGEMDIVRLYPASLRKSGTEWKMALPDDMDGQFKSMKQEISGTRGRPDFAKTRVEPLGHVMDGKSTALVIYRRSMPMGDTAMTNLAVASVDVPRRRVGRRAQGRRAGRDGNARPEARPGPVANARRGRRPSRGGRRGQGPRGGEQGPRRRADRPVPRQDEGRGRRAPGRPQGRGGRGRRQIQGRTRRPRRRLPGRLRGPAPPHRRPGPTPSGRASPLAVPRPRAPGNPARTTAPGSAAPEGYVDLPATFFGGDRDRFHDVAPAGGLLVGVKVSYVVKFGGNKTSSVQPIYRVGTKLVDGKRQGTLLGKETKAVAKEGYAVGGINTHTGLSVDGFELVFMKIDGDHLDPADSYNSPWLGDPKGGSPRNVTSDGKIPVGLQGRAAKEVNALGLIIRDVEAGQ